MTINLDHFQQGMHQGPGVLSRLIGQIGRRSLQAGEHRATHVGSLFEVHDEGQVLIVLATLPNVQPDDIQVTVYPTAVIVQVRGSGRRQACPLPAIVSTEHVTHKFRNGVLTITLRKRFGP